MVRDHIPIVGGGGWDKGSSSSHSNIGSHSVYCIYYMYYSIQYILYTRRGGAICTAERERENINRKKLEMGWENVGDRDGKESGHHGVGQSR